MITFRLINCAIFFALLLYGFKRYVFNVFLAQMAERDTSRKELELEKENLAIMQARLDEQIYTNERVHKELMATLHVWQRSFDQKQQEMREEKERIKYQLELKMERRREVQLLNLIQDDVVLPAVEESNKALHEYFTQQKHGHAYIKKVLAYMERTL